MTRHRSRIACCIFALCAIAPIHAAADECSGGANGGMGASGNDCSSPELVVGAAPEPSGSADPASAIAASTSPHASSRPALRNVAHPRKNAMHRKSHRSPQLHAVATDSVKP